MRMETKVKTTSHTKYNLNYHFVWIPKYRKPVLKGKKAERVKDLIRDVARQKGFDILEMEVMDDHIHLFVSCPPRFSPAEIMQFFKGITSRRYDQLYSDSLRWTNSYFVGSAGNVSAETIEKYIQEQEENL